MAKEINFSKQEEEDFSFWMEDGNVSKNPDGSYSTQDAQWQNNLKDMDALKEYYYKEFLNGESYAGGGKLKKKSKISRKYKYFAQHKENKKIYDGWEIIDDVETLKHFAKFDLKDNDLNPSDFTIISAKFLLRKGIDPYDSDNWYKIQYEGGGSLDDKHLVAKAIEYITGTLVQEDTIQFEASQISFKYKNTNTWASISKKLIEDTIRMHGKSLKGRFEKGGEAGFNDEGTDMIMYHEKKGNFIIPKGQVYLWLYEGDNIGEKLQSEEYNWVFYPYTSQNLAWQSGYIPPLKKIWTKKFQKDHKGSEKLLGVIKAFLTDEKGEKELFIDMMSVNPTKKKKGIMSYMIKELRDAFDLTQDQITFSSLTDEGEIFVAKKTYDKGGNVNIWDKGDITIVNGEYQKKAEVVPTSKDDRMTGNYFVVFRDENLKIIYSKDDFETYESALEYAKNNVNDISHLIKHEKGDKFVAKKTYDKGGELFNLIKIEKDPMAYWVEYQGKIIGNVAGIGRFNDWSWSLRTDKVDTTSTFGVFKTKEDASKKVIDEYRKYNKYADGGGVGDNFEKDFEKNLELEGWMVLYYNDNIDTVTREKATQMSVVRVEPYYESYSIKIPKKKEVTFAWVMDKVNKDQVYKNFSENFNSILKKLGYKGMNVYPTTYGIGVFIVFGNKSESKSNIEKVLDDYKIDYTTEYSDAHYVFRYKISKSSENIKKLEKIKFADGGDVPHEDKMFQLPLEMVVYVPSTQDVDKVISVDEMDSRVDEVKQYLASKFGGYSSADKLGGFVDSKGSLVNEDVVQVTSFSTKEAYDEHKEELIQQLAKWGKEWGQEAIGFEFEGDLMYVPQEFKNGGEADDFKKKDMTDEAGFKGEEELIIEILDESFNLLEKQVPTTKKSIKSISIRDVNPLEITSFMNKNKIPDDAYFDGRDNGYDAWDDILLSWEVDVPTTIEERNKYRRRRFTDIAFIKIYDSLKEKGYKRKGFDSSLLKQYKDTTLYDLYTNKEFDRILQYYSMYFVKE